MVYFVEVGSNRVGNVFIKRDTTDSDGLAAVISKSEGNSGKGFTSVSFDRKGESFCATDSSGCMYVFRLQQNRYSLVQRLGKYGTALAYSPKRMSEIFVGTSDNSIRFVDSETCKLIGTLKGHRSNIHSISVHPSGGYILTCSHEASLLFDMENFTRKRTLNGAAVVGLSQAIFDPSGKYVFTALNNGTILAWDCAHFSLQYTLSIHADKEEEQTLAEKSVPNPLRFCFDPTASFCIAGSSTLNALYVWNMNNRKLVRILDLPNSARGVEDVIYLPTGEQVLENLKQKTKSGSTSLKKFLLQRQSLPAIVAAVCRDGIVRFVDVINGSVAFEIGNVTSCIKKVSFSANGKYAIALCADASLRLFDIPVSHQYFETGDKTFKTSKVPSFVALKSSQNRDVEEFVRLTLNEDVTREGSSSSKLAAVEHMASRDKGNVFDSRDTNQVTICDPKKENLNPLFRLANAQKKTHCNNIVPPEELEFLELDKSSTLLNRGKLRAIVKKYGEFPARYRFLIWKFLLQLPYNSEAYHGLVSKGEHISWRKLVRQYPIKSRKLMRSLEQQLSNLSHWGTIFEELPYLPLIVFPFVKLYANEPVSCFEMCATFLQNWCHNWFDYFPNPPITVLNEIESLLQKYDPGLYDFMVHKDIPSSVYAWNLMQSLFTEVFSKEEFTIFLDHLFANPPSFFKFVVVAYLRHLRSSIMQKKTVEGVESLLRTSNGANSMKVINEAYRLYGLQLKNAPEVNSFSPIAKGSVYASFDAYPKYIVDYHLLERERIRMEEEDYWNRKKVIAELKKVTEETKIQEQIWARQQRLLNDAEQARRDQIAEEDRRLDRESARVDFLLQEQILADTQAKSLALQNTMQNETQAKLIEMQKLEEEIKKKSSQRSRTIAKAEEDNIVRQMRLKSQESMMQEALRRSNPANIMREAVELNQKKRDLEEEIAFRKIKAEEEERAVASQNFERRVRVMASENEAQRLSQEVHLKFQLDDVKRQFQELEVERQKRLTKIQEEQLYGLASDIETKRYEELLAQKDEEMRLNEIKMQEERFQREKAQRRQKIIDEKMKQHLESREMRLKKIRDVESLQRAKEIEAQILRERSNFYDQDVREERELQRILFEIEKQKERDYELDQMLASREADLERRFNLQTQMDNVSREAVRQEREKFSELRKELRRDTERMTNMNVEGEALLLTAASKRGTQSKSQSFNLDDSTSTSNTYTVDNMDALNQSHLAHMEELKQEAEALIERRKATQEALKNLLNSPNKRS
eukprot:Nk52_evm65s221 gene=Nk52_evmTU65s221